jgi:hypothetical protein
LIKISVLGVLLVVVASTMLQPVADAKAKMQLPQCWLEDDEQGHHTLHLTLEKQSFDLRINKGTKGKNWLK